MRAYNDYVKISLMVETLMIEWLLDIYNLYRT